MKVVIKKTRKIDRYSKEFCGKFLSTDSLFWHIRGKGMQEEQNSLELLIRHETAIKQLYELFAETLDRLCHIGSAYQHAPDVSL